MKLYPLVFNFNETVMGNGFIARVNACGRAVLSIEDDGTWLHGVQPGSFSGGGETSESALDDFWRMYRHILIDFAAEATTFEVFSGMVKEFFEEVSGPYLADWTAARAAVRLSASTSAAGLPLIKNDEATEPKYTIDELAPPRVDPTMNELIRDFAEVA